MHTHTKRNFTHGLSHSVLFEYSLGHKLQKHEKYTACHLGVSGTYAFFRAYLYYLAHNSTLARISTCIFISLDASVVFSPSLVCIPLVTLGVRRPSGSLFDTSVFFLLSCRSSSYSRKQVVSSSLDTHLQMEIGNLASLRLANVGTETNLFQQEKNAIHESDTSLCTAIKYTVSSQLTHILESFI